MANKLKNFIQDGQKVTLNYEDGELELRVLTPEIVRVFENRGNASNSYAIAGDKEIKTNFRIEEKDDHAELSTEKLFVKIYDDKKIDVYDEKDHPLIIDYRGERTPIDRQMDEEHKKLAESEGHEVAGSKKEDKNYYEIVKKLASDEQFYGLGDKTGFLNKRHYAYNNWNTDDPAPQVESFPSLYKSVPILLGLKDGHPYGIFFDNTYRNHIDLGKESNDYYYYSAVDGNIDYYIIGGDSLKEIITNYTYLTGRVPMPQKWTLGYQQSRWGYSVSQKQVEKIAENLRKYDLPCDVLHLDIDYMRGYRVFTWRKDTYESPDKFIKKMRKLGFRIITIIDPGVKKDDDYKIYKEGLEKGYFVKAPDGTVYVNEVWPGDAVFPDFGRKEVRKWWARNCKYLVDLGVSGIWDDMNEPASFRGEIPQDIVFHNEEQASTHKKMHNVYGHNMAKATYEGLKKYSGKRPFVITRAAYAGTQKFSTVWTGDNQSLWTHVQMMIPQLCNLGMSGFSFAGTDIGGFGADTTPELLTRWIEGALFSPLYRNHAALGTRSQEPWIFGEPTLSIYRKYLKLRYRFIPYLYDEFYREIKTGLPIMRPLVLNYENDPQVYNLNDEYMVGEDILAAPVVQEGQTKRAVYLPKGKWIDFWNGVEYSGKTTILVDAPIGKLPLFIKKNTILPWGKEVSHISDEPDESMTFRVFGKKGKYIHYQDNGTDFKYQKGEYNLYKVKVSKDGSVKVMLEKHGFGPVYRRITVQLPNKKVEFKYKNGEYVRK
ncbi:alpha-glucosidase [Lactobacillus acidophilus]|uniref:glycoside hydrolase family 31 protein n=1 Tax=Lactobacillus acidophilus TaxID=1579 RepID=UPI000F763C91|nr:glycoside hydrolase family 31 protein [Lactobacillus acidophilus]AZN77364.1 alpha-glucosidase [Lactobacillus acidophilus]